MVLSLTLDCILVWYRNSLWGKRKKISQVSTFLWWCKNDMKYIKSAATYQIKTMMVIPESALCFVCDYKASIKSFISGSHYLFKRNSSSEAIFKVFSTTFKMVFSISGKESWNLGLADSLSKWPVHQFCSLSCCGKKLQRKLSHRCLKWGEVPISLEKTSSEQYQLI